MPTRSLHARGQVRRGQLPDGKSRPTRRAIARHRAASVFSRAPWRTTGSARQPADAIRARSGGELAAALAAFRTTTVE